jgi:hypothetical protein
MKKREKVRYEVDPHNRLIIRSSGRKSNVPTFRCLADGIFRIRGKHHLTYHVKQSQDSTIPQQITFSGNWSLDKNHNVVFTLNKWGNQIAGNKLVVKGTITDVSGTRLLVAVTTKTLKGHTRVYALQLTGAWQADTSNRLVFNVAREKGHTDQLTFKGAWKVTSRNQLIYRYVTKGLKRGTKRLRTLTLKGSWDICKKGRLSYVLSSTVPSVFDFTSSIGVPMRRAGRDALKYEVGIVLRRRKVIRRTIILFGNWKIDRRKGVLFEVRYEKERFHSIVFGADIRLMPNYNLMVRLKGKHGNDLGVKVTLSQRLLQKAGAAYLDILGTKKELTVTAGAGIKW